MDRGIGLRPELVHETVDGETIIIDLSSGVYHSLVGTSAEAWDLIADGRSFDEIAAQLADRHGSTAIQVSAALHKLLVGLAGAGVLAEPPPERVNGSHTTFSMPAVETYTDMRDHLSVDPIHDVEREVGWPARVING